MLIKIKKDEKEEILSYVKKDPCQNPYLYIDLLTVGVDSEQVSAWKVLNGDEYVGIVYKYYNTLQLFFVPNAQLPDDFYEFLKDNNFVMMTGRDDIIHHLREKLPMYSDSYGVIMTKTDDTEVDHDDVQVADVSQMTEIAVLICSDEGIGSHYEISSFADQLKKRLLYEHCRNYVICENKEIVCHMATYAETSDLAILGGLITKKECRGKGYGKSLLDHLSNALIRENKRPLLYCYFPKTIQWYKQQNWKEISRCGKLELIQK